MTVQIFIVRPYIYIDVFCTHLYICRSSDNEDVNDARTVRSGDSASVRRKSIQLYRRGKMNNKQDSSDDSDSVVSLHRNAIHRRNMLIWRDHWQPESANRFPSIDSNNNEGAYASVQAYFVAGYLNIKCLYQFWLLSVYNFTVRRYTSTVYAVIGCLVYVSVTHQYCTKMAKLRIMQTTSHDSPETLVLCCQRSWGKFERGHPTD